MLKNIPKLLTPELLRAMMEMGHGEELLLCDGNYPAKTFTCERLYIMSCRVDELLEAILYCFPLDLTVQSAATVMDSCGRERLERYAAAVEANGSKLDKMGRFEFYERARSAAALVITADTTRGGNILLKKGVVSEDDLPAVADI
jgi:L-fucose mutarotase